MFHWFPKDFEMIITEKGKFDYDVLECIYEYERKAKKIKLKQMNQRENQLMTCK